jgi:predicted ABC-type ATPase
MLSRIRELTAQRVDFAFETTLATRSYVSFIREARQLGYHVTLVYFWLSSPELAVSRVAARVAAGGHNVDEETIRRRYGKGIYNLFNLYMREVDYWITVDNSFSPFSVIAEGVKDGAQAAHSPTFQTLQLWAKKK